MDQINIVQAYVQKLKSQLSSEEKQRQDYETKYNQECEIREQLDEKISDLEIILKQKSDRVEELELKIEQLETDLKCYQESVSKKGGFLGKMFNGNQVDQYLLKIKQQENMIIIRDKELETAHAKIFSLQQMCEGSEQAKEKLNKDYESKIQKILTINAKYKNKIQVLENNTTQLNAEVESQNKQIEILNNSLNNLNIDVEDLQNSKIKLQTINKNQENQIFQFLEQIKKQRKHIETLNNTINSDHQLLQRIIYYIDELLKQETTKIVAQQLKDIIQYKELQMKDKEAILSNQCCYRVFLQSKQSKIVYEKFNELAKQNKLLEDKLKIYKLEDKIKAQ
ncbi:hypothetical protein pb186bvf_014930 [Paramecium bursaria]